jgi:pyruvyltransferase
MSTFKQTAVWKTAKRMLLDPVRRAAFKLTNSGCIPLYYCTGTKSPNNWGDALSPLLVGMLSGRPVVKMLWQHQHRYLAIGSILGNANGRAEVWGSGFLWPDETLAEAPQAVHAVRGPRSRAKLLEQGIDCPEIYGDPALLLPRFFNPEVAIKYAVGIVPHYIDKDHPWLERYRQDPQVRIIDVEGDTYRFVEEVKSCELIVSTSLHGLICADAYGVPCLWIDISDRLWGGSFKFIDYFESVGRGTTEPVRTDATMTLGQVTQRHQPYEVKINLDLLIAACPFIAPEVRLKLLSNP